jgi:hypothetical protein
MSSCRSEAAREFQQADRGDGVGAVGSLAHTRDDPVEAETASSIAQARCSYVK